MSYNRRRTGEWPGIDCPEELTFVEFLQRTDDNPIVRVQGKVFKRTKESGRLVRFNLAVRVLSDTEMVNEHGVGVLAERVRWNWRAEKWETIIEDGSPVIVTVTWAQLDYVSWVASGDPNGTWIKVTTRE